MFDENIDAEKEEPSMNLSKNIVKERRIGLFMTGAS
jgi:hypothetical protein